MFIEMRRYLVFLLLALLFPIRLLLLPRISLKNAQKVRATGRLQQEPQISGNSQTFWLGPVKIVTSRYPEYHYGEELEVIGRIESASFGLSFFSFKSYQINYPKANRLNRANSAFSI